MSLERCAFVWGCRGKGLIFHGTLYLMAVNSLNGAYQHNQINYLPRRWQYYRLREECAKWQNRKLLICERSATTFNLLFHKCDVNHLFQRVRGRGLPFLHEEYHSQEDDDEEEDAGDDPGDLHRVVGLFLRLHRVGFVSGCSWKTSQQTHDGIKQSAE